MGEIAALRVPERRILVVTGHYGSGKTEFCVSLALALVKQGFGPFERLALADLDIINPYFRSRERREQLAAAGVPVYGSAYGHEVTAEIPELAANIRAPLEDAGCRVIVDVGGNDSGALVLRQFGKYFAPEDTLNLCVVNANRPETRTVEGVLEHLRAIEANMGMCVDGLVNNTHLLRETDAGCVAKGHALCAKVAERTGLGIWCDCYPRGILPDGEMAALYANPMPLGLYMRPTWLDAGV